ncbi:PP78/83 [Plodia interpunctella granulovirus]|uniref:PP78/83 n=1 Tax=Plodia interpunctella granulovirus TaxID=262175 RepID=A0A1L5JGX6_9BBAC|nr:PP78/83 [Plodia interpunctella granulovirus]APO13886.1 PP78/83 [Plodia interpunctella granulovirus]
MIVIFFKSCTLRKMDLLGFIRRADLTTDVRDIIFRMKWNRSLKEKLEAAPDENHVSMTVAEAIEFFETLHQLIVRPSLSTTNARPATPPPRLSITPPPEGKLIDIDI